MDEYLTPNFRGDKSNIFHAGRLKKYPDGSYELLVCNRPIFRESGWEKAEGKKYGKRIEINGTEYEWIQDPAAERTEAASAAEAREADAGTAEASRSRAARRAAARVRDLALCNPFRYFVTLTLDPAKVDRYDVKAITKKLNTWLDNQVRRNGLLYVLVAERHKDGAVHFHGLINEAAGLVPSGTWKVPGHKKPMRPRSEAQRRAWAAQGAEAGFCEVFNWEGWRYGFSTAIPLYGDYSAAVAYVCKYIRKQTTGPEGPVGGRWYYHGGRLATPAAELLDVGLQEMESNPDLYRFEIPEAGLQFGIIRGRYKENETEFTKAGMSNGPENQGGSGPEALRGRPESETNRYLERRISNEDGILVGKGIGGGAAGTHAGKQTRGAGEFTHGTSDFGCSEPEAGPAQTSILDCGAENREAEAREPSWAAVGGPQTERGEILGLSGPL